MDNEKLISYIFLSGFISGSIFIYSGIMAFTTGMITGIVCSRAGWIDRVYEKFSHINMQDCLKFYTSAGKVFA